MSPKTPTKQGNIGGVGVAAEGRHKLCNSIRKICFFAESGSGRHGCLRVVTRSRMVVLR